ncbi:MAG: hypothetical protein AAF664_25380, partial [Planctomycetota bacterium]
MAAMEGLKFRERPTFNYATRVISHKTRAKNAPHIFVLGTAAFLLTAWFAGGTQADEANWIWSSRAGQDGNVEPGTTAYFRKFINLRTPAEGRITITADDRYQLYLNGTKIGTGESTSQMQQYDITELLEIGRNVIAVSVTNASGSTAALAARVAIKPEVESGGPAKWYTFSSDASWKASQQSQSDWTTPAFNDRLWSTATSFGVLGETAPWDMKPEQAIAKSAPNQVKPPAADQPKVEQKIEQRERFQIQKGFGVQRVMDNRKVGSLI